MSDTRWIAAGIVASPRRNGNSATLLNALLDGVRCCGTDAETHYLNSLSYRGCQDCDGCPPDRCRIHDPLDDVIGSLARADIWVLATPVYFDGMAGQMKLFFDRCRWLMRNSEDGTRYRPRLTGSRSAAIIVTYEMEENPEYRRIPEILSNYLSWIGDFGTPLIVCEPNLGERNAAAKRPDLIQWMRSIGEELVADIATRRSAAKQRENQ